MAIKSEVTHFYSDKNTEFTVNKQVDHTKPSLNLATLKYTTKKKITDAENEGVLVFTTDTGELFVGTGYDTFIKKISDVFIGNYNEFPSVGVVDKIYLAIDERKIYYWNGTRYLRFAEVDTVAYQDVFTVDKQAKTKFILNKTPLNGVVTMNINGISYFPDDFTYNKDKNLITWNVKNGGFEITNSKVVFEYDILLEGNKNLTTNTQNAVSANSLPTEVTVSNDDSWNVALNSSNELALFYNGKEVVKCNKKLLGGI